MANLISKYTSKFNQSYTDALKNVSSEYDNFSKIWNKIFITSDNDGIDGFEFHIRKSESIKLTNTISEYVLEEGATVAQAITNQPIEITLTGTIGNTIFKAPKTTILTSKIQNKLNPLSIFSGNLSTQAQTYLNKANSLIEKVDGYVEKVGHGIEYLKTFTNQLDTKQKQAFYNLMLLWKGKKLTSVKTDIWTLDNMVIQDVSIDTDEATTGKAEVSINMKQITFAKTILTKSKKTSKMTSIQKSSIVNKGKDKGVQSYSLSYYLKGGTNLS